MMYVYKLITAGLVEAYLLVKNGGTKPENEDKAPKRWEFKSVKHPRLVLPISRV